MPTVNDIVAVAEALKKKSIAVMRDRCAAVRHRRSSCRKCVEVCPSAAIDVGGNEVTVDAGACVSCGACAGICPTEAFVSIDPTDSDLSGAAVSAMMAADGRAVFACARAASKRRADPSTYVEVPCLPRINEAVMLEAAARGASDILLVDGDCATCKFRDCSRIVDETVSEANNLLATHGSSVEAKRATGFPESLLVEGADSLFGSTRRSFFSDAVGSAKEAAMAAAKVTVTQELGFEHRDAAIGERLRVGKGGTLPQIRAERHEAAINALDALGSPVVEYLESRLFGSVVIDAETCNSCGMCVTFCPTGALRRDGSGKPGDRLRYIEFQACDCVQCGLCVDVCWKGAVTLSSRVDTNQLFDFEPVVFDLR